MKALILNCTFEPSPSVLRVEELAGAMIEALQGMGCSTEIEQIAHLGMTPRVHADSQSDKDVWAKIRQKIAEADIIIVASPAAFLGRSSSMAQKVLKRLDGMIRNEQEGDESLAHDKVAGVVVTGNEDGTHHVIKEICGALVGVGFTVPPLAWTYWNRIPGPSSDCAEDSDWPKESAEVAANNLVTTAKALL